VKTKQTGRAAPKKSRNQQQSGSKKSGALKRTRLTSGSGQDDRSGQESIVPREAAALPSLEKARSILERCRATGECMRIRAIAQAVASVAASEAARDEALAIVLMAKARIGELTAEVKATPPAEKGKRARGVRSGAERTRTERLAADNLSRKNAAECEKIALLRKSGDLDRMIATGARPTTAGAVVLGRLAPAEREEVFAKLSDEPDLRKAIGAVKREGVRKTLEDVAARKVKAIMGLYDVVVIDPPWPMERIEREVQASQKGFDYPTMNEDELRKLRAPCADDCHVWLWTTHRFPPLALDLLAEWKLKYVCTFVWHKAGGYQPTGLPQYNCEFALYARRGSPRFVDLKALNTCFSGKRRRHSEKPEEFYRMVRRVTAGRRIDMFNRRVIEGFDGWGKEAGVPSAADSHRQTESGRSSEADAR
jgi:N6-adenosine-specific RNA methylase IME4